MLIFCMSCTYDSIHNKADFDFNNRQGVNELINAVSYFKPNLTFLFSTIRSQM